MVSPGYSVCDVGCDHAFTPICLVKDKKSPRALALDVNEGPILRAREHIAAEAVDGLVEERLSDGLEAYIPGEADALIISGMGGRLMIRILSDYPQKTSSFKELILSPQSDIPAVRIFLYNAGFRIADEDMVKEDGKFYFIIKVVPGDEGALPGSMCSRGVGEDNESCAAYREISPDESECFADYGEALIRKRSPVFKEYLEHMRGKFESALKEITDGKNKPGTAYGERLEKREREIVKELQKIAYLLDYYTQI